MEDALLQALMEHLRSLTSTIQIDTCTVTQVRAHTHIHTHTNA